jgi:Saxitoxin biosynthesis operon protein SxtJ
MSTHAPLARERSFGLSIGSLMLASALLFAFRGRLVRAEILAVVGIVLVVLGAFKPVLLKAPSDVWWRFAHVLAYVNARVLLTVLFAAALVPVSVVWRLTGRDPLARRRDRWPGWSPHPHRYADPKHYTRMF